MGFYNRLCYKSWCWPIFFITITNSIQAMILLCIKIFRNSFYFPFHWCQFTSCFNIALFNLFKNTYKSICLGFYITHLTFKFFNVIYNLLVSFINGGLTLTLKCIDLILHLESSVMLTVSHLLEWHIGNHHWDGVIISSLICILYQFVFCWFDMLVYLIIILYFYFLLYMLSHVVFHDLLPIFTVNLKACT